MTKHLRPMSLTPLLPKLAEDFVVERFVKPAVLTKIDSQQFGSIPNSSTVHALVDMTQRWTNDTDGNGATTRVVLFEFRKAFDLIDHSILARKLRTFDLPNLIVHRITDFLQDRKGGSHRGPTICNVILPNIKFYGKCEQSGTSFNCPSKLQDLSFKFSSGIPPLG